MKKFAIASVIALAATAASALDLGVNASRTYGGADRNGYGLTVGQSFGAFGAEASVDRYTGSGIDQNRWSLVGTMPVATVGKVSLTAKAGVAYLDNQGTLTSDSAVTTCRGRSAQCMTSTSTTSSEVANGFAGVVGVGASMPLTDKLSATVDYRYQRGQDRVNAFNGSTVNAGLKYKF